MAHGLDGLDLQAVVMRIAVPPVGAQGARAGVHPGPAPAGRGEQEPPVRRLPDGQHHVGVVAHERVVHAARAHVRGGERHVLDEPLLHGQVPVQDVVALGVGLDVQAVGGGGVEVREAEGLLGEGALRQVAHGGAHVEGRPLGGLGREDPGQGQDVVDAEPAADGRPAAAARIPGEPDPRLEVLERGVRLEVAVDGDDGAAVEIAHHGEPALRVLRLRAHLVAQAVVEGQPGPHAPAVVHVAGEDARPHLRLLGARRVEAEEIVRLVGQEVRQGAEVEAPVRHAQAQLVVLDALEGEAEADRVVPPVDERVVVELVRVLDVAEERVPAHAARGEGEAGHGDDGRRAARRGPQVQVARDRVDGRALVVDEGLRAAVPDPDRIGEVLAERVRLLQAHHGPRGQVAEELVLQGVRDVEGRVVVHDRHERVVPRREAVVDPAGGEVLPQLPLGRRGEAPGVSGAQQGPVGQRPEVEIARDGGIHGDGARREPSLARGRGGNRGHGGDPFVQADPLVVGEEEGLVLPDRRPQGGAELVAGQGRLRGGLVEVVARVQRVVAEELVAGAVEGVRARARDRVDDASRRAAVLRRVVARQHRELLDGVDAQVHAARAPGRAVGVVVDAHAVQAVVVLLRPVAGHGQLVPVTAVAARRGHAVHRLRADADHAGLQGRERRPVPPVEGQLSQRFSAHDRAQGRRRRVDRRRLGGDGDRLLEASRVQPQVKDQRRPDRELDALPGRGHEPGHGRRHLVPAGPEVRRPVHPAVVGDDLRGDSCLHIPDEDLRPGEHRPRAVEHGSRDGPAGNLRVDRGNDQSEREGAEDEEPGRSDSPHGESLLGLNGGEAKPGPGAMPFGKCPRTARTTCAAHALDILGHGAGVLRHGREMRGA